jgi:hypothetical protein
MMKVLVTMNDTALNFHLHHMLINLLQVPVTGDSHTERQTVTSEAKKRKPDEESESQEEKPPKKIVTSSSSKLMAFAFKKS